MRIGVVGTGNVAYHLCKSLENSGHSVSVVSSRTLKKAAEFCAKLYEAKPINHLDFSAFKTDIIFLAVKDEAIEECSKKIVAKNDCLLVHLSGSKCLNEMVCEYEKAVFYPLMSFSKQSSVSWKEIYIFIECNSDSVFSKLSALAQSLGSKTKKINADEKKALHIAAVFAQNFGNHMLKIASDICQAEGIPFSTLKPLIEQGVQKCFLIGPEQSQTGPAVRNDQSTLDDHFNFLEGNPELQKLYRVISEHIVATYS